jgi:hypothetical protein
MSNSCWEKAFTPPRGSTRRTDRRFRTFEHAGIEQNLSPPIDSIVRDRLETVRPFVMADICENRPRLSSGAGLLTLEKGITLPNEHSFSIDLRRGAVK